MFLKIYPELKISIIYFYLNYILFLYIHTYTWQEKYRILLNIELTLETVIQFTLTYMNVSSIGATIESMTSRRQIQDGGPHDFRSKMAAPTTPRWRPHEVRYEMAAPVTRSVTPRRVSQRPRPREGSVTS